MRVKPPVLEHINTICLEQEAGLDKNDSVWHLGGVQMAPHQALALESGHNPSCYQGFSQQPLQRLTSQDIFARSWSQVLNQPLNSKQM